MSALQKLMFHIGVSDGASGKMLGLQKAVDRTCRSVRQDFEGIKAGALTAAGAGMSLYQMVNPAVDFNRAVGEVRSLGTGEDALAYLQEQAGRHFDPALVAQFMTLRTVIEEVRTSWSD